ncbi:ATP-binding protein [Chloroflexota bacterium]
MHLTFENVDQFCADVQCEEDDPIIDLSRITFFRPFSLVYLGMFLRYHNSNGKSFSVLPPIATKARKYLSQQQFWERFNFDPKTMVPADLTQFSNTTSLNDIIDIEHRSYIGEDIAKQVFEILRRKQVKINIGLFSVMISELIDNFEYHSQSNLAVCAMQYYPNLNRVVFAVGDCGIGIKESLISNPNNEHLKELSEHEIALKSFEPLVTRMHEGGMGLTEVREGIIEMGGRLTCSTGIGYVIISQKEEASGNMAHYLPGVQMELSVPEVA